MFKWTKFMLMPFYILKAVARGPTIGCEIENTLETDSLQLSIMDLRMFE